MNFRRIMGITRKEFIHVFRDWRSLAMTIVTQQRAGAKGADESR